jgi:hypothetical protein
MKQKRRAALLLTLMAIAIVGCDSPDRRLSEFAQQATDQQARQNERIAEQSQSVARQSQQLASAAHDLVEQDAAARRDLFQAQDKLQQQNHAERSVLDQHREQVEAVRQAAAKAAIHDPIIAQAIITAGLILAAMLPLLVTAYALRRLPEHRPVDELLGDSLLLGLLTDLPISPASASSTDSPPNSTAQRWALADESPTTGDDFTDQ